MYKRQAHDLINGVDFLLEGMVVDVVSDASTETELSLIHIYGKKQEYDWDAILKTIRRLQPKAVTAIMGDDVRWVGNEMCIRDRM